jgi:hypothetical protein
MYGTVAISSKRAALPVFIVCAVATLAAGAVLYGYGALVRALGVPMHAGDIGASKADPITPINFTIGVVFCMVIGTVLAVCVARWASRPARTFARVTILLVVVSLAFPLLASHAAESTRLSLALAHIVAAAIVIPIVTSRLRDVR